MSMSQLNRRSRWMWHMNSTKRSFKTRISNSTDDLKPLTSSRAAAVWTWLKMIHQCTLTSTTRLTIRQKCQACINLPTMPTTHANITMWSHCSKSVSKRSPATPNVIRTSSCVVIRLGSWKHLWFSCEEMHQLKHSSKWRKSMSSRWAFRKSS
jgi:hypothetical protein